ncbi:RNA polymerase sigma factor [bacterium]|nr:RNA polymerase sigma factor [bacterium]MBU1073692.1 RNA polymerase sigma factor [bacterium]MBU1675026.1 RNA polymerase sigma factor [bacterium]
MDKRAFVEILQRQRDRVYSYSLYYLRDRDDAEDVTQDAFLRLWNKRHEVDPQRVEAWLIRVAHNLCIDRTRRRDAARRRLELPDALAAAANATSAAETAPDHGLQREQTRAMLLDAMDALQDETRSAMILHYFQGLKLDEVAGMLGIKTSTVKVQLHRARQVLRRVLEPGRECDPAVKRETV